MSNLVAVERPTLSGSVRIARFELSHPQSKRQSLTFLVLFQRESNATIKAAPTVYEQKSPAKPKNLIEIDCRGLEFTDFKPDVGAYHFTKVFRIIDLANRVIGKPKA